MKEKEPVWEMRPLLFSLSAYIVSEGPNTCVPCYIIVIPLYTYIVVTLIYVVLITTTAPMSEETK